MLTIVEYLELSRYGISFLGNIYEIDTINILSFLPSGG